MDSLFKFSYNVPSLTNVLKCVHEEGIEIQKANKRIISAIGLFKVKSCINLRLFKYPDK